MKIGDAVLVRDGLPLPASSPDAERFLRQAGGFAFFGDACLDAITRCPYTVAVASEAAHVLALHRRQLDAFLGTAAGGLATRGAVVAALSRCKTLAVLREDQLDALVGAAEPVRYAAGEVVAPAAGAPCAAFFLVRSGEALLVPPGGGGGGGAAAIEPAARLTAGELFNERVLTAPAAPLEHSLVAGPGGAVVVTFDLAALNRALAGAMGAGAAAEHLRPAAHTAAPPAAAAAAAAAVPPRAAVPAAPMAAAAAPPPAAAPPAAAAAAAVPQPIPGVGLAGAAADARAARGLPPIDFRDLELHRVVGTGQFGLVRVVRHAKTGEVFALKVR